MVSNMDRQWAATLPNSSPVLRNHANPSSSRQSSDNRIGLSNEVVIEDRTLFFLVAIKGAVVPWHYL